MAWVLLAVAGCLEIVWALAMKTSEGFTRIWPTTIMVVALVASLGLLAVAMRSLPLGTSYMVWTGIGAIGTFIAGVLLFGEAMSLSRLVAAGFVLVGIVMFKASA
ncbi:QacE family quaternary ammonium compound efflux SMR transporter [Pseudooceanicola sp. GBMRC 2024]|uniref:Guanidinium exporter n=1 Tax=Pseudooceanicola albus TaxID=2692189 RepID=A0A6L7G262_9RHOB|nr:multidrug efflux SMR transporter [Pseudooceanicola albus]MXN17822.1 QacE family quaternary ammonium compound efflux SMR transporter [Pseudooceanicola albus]